MSATREERDSQPTAPAHSVPCREANMREGEPLAGTAPNAAAHIFLRWPKRHWAADAMASPGLPDWLRPWLKEHSAINGDTTLRLGTFGDDVEHETDVLAFYPQRTIWLRAVPIARLREEFERLSVGDGASSRYANANLPQRFILVCTHGKRDRCCAQYGTGVVKALREAIARIGLPWFVGESTHTGGHRFAATGVVFPDWRAFGRLDQGQIEGFVETLLAGSTYGRWDRGSLHLDGPLQAAEFACRERLGASDVLLGHTLLADDGPVRIYMLRFQSGSFEAAVRAETLDCTASCGDHPAPRKVWRLIKLSSGASP